MVPLGNTTVTASPGFTRYSSVTARATVTTGVVLVAVEHGAAPLPPPTAWPTDGVTVVTRIGPGSKTTSPKRMMPVAGRPRAVCHRLTAAAVAAV